MPALLVGRLRIWLGLWPRHQWLILLRRVCTVIWSTALVAVAMLTIELPGIQPRVGDRYGIITAIASRMKLVFYGFIWPRGSRWHSQRRGHKKRIHRCCNDLQSNDTFHWHSPETYRLLMYHRLGCLAATLLSMLQHQSRWQGLPHLNIGIQPDTPPPAFRACRDFWQGRFLSRRSSVLCLAISATISIPRRASGCP